MSHEHSIQRRRRDLMNEVAVDLDDCGIRWRNPNFRDISPGAEIGMGLIFIPAVPDLTSYHIVMVSV